MDFQFSIPGTWSRKSTLTEKLSFILNLAECVKFQEKIEKEQDGTFKPEKFHKHKPRWQWEKSFCE